MSAPQPRRSLGDGPIRSISSTPHNLPSPPLSTNTTRQSVESKVDSSPSGDPLSGLLDDLPPNDEKSVNGSSPIKSLLTSSNSGSRPPPPPAIVPRPSDDPSSILSSLLSLFSQRQHQSLIDITSEIVKSQRYKATVRTLISLNGPTPSEATFENGDGDVDIIMIVIWYRIHSLFKLLPQTSNQLLIELTHLNLSPPTPGNGKYSYSPPIISLALQYSQATLLIDSQPTIESIEPLASYIIDLRTTEWYNKLGYEFMNAITSAGGWESGLEIGEDILENLVGGEKDIMKGTLGRIALSVGDIEKAERYFEGIEGDEGEVCQGLILMSKKDFTGARDVLLKVVLKGEIEEEEKAIKSVEEFWRDLKVMKNEESVYMSAVNNLVLAELYLGTVAQPLARLEKLILTNPIRYMTDVVVFNLCTLYDLSGDNVVSGRRKRMLEMVGMEYRLGILKSSFRI